MTVTVVCSARGAPGVTTLAWCLASTWPVGRRLLLVEADPAGGVLAARTGRSADTGWASLASHGRHTVTADLLADQSQQIGDGVWLLPAPPSPERTSVLLESLGDRVLAAADGWDGDVVVDVGRCNGTGPTGEMLAAADRVLLTVRPSVDAVQVTAAVLDRIRGGPQVPVEVVVVGDRPYPPDEVAAVLEVPLAAAVPWDPRAEAGVWPAPVGWWVRRAPLLRTTAQLAADLAADSTDLRAAPADGDGDRSQMGVTALAGEVSDA